MKIDHVLFFAKPEDSTVSEVYRLGLDETDRRAHPGQGTENVCFVFDNMFIELLWIVNEDEASNPVTERTRILERSKWKDSHACPFGISWRTSEENELFANDTWKYCPEYLPDDLAIDVSVDSDDLSQPLMFMSPGKIAPIDWPKDKQKGLQRRLGLGAVKQCQLLLPKNIEPSSSLLELTEKTNLRLLHDSGNAYQMDFDIEVIGGNSTKSLKLG